ncbi:MAG: protein kinase domain-containing protein [Elusimicrobiales bacterium]
MNKLVVYLFAALLPAILPGAAASQTSEDYARRGADSYRKADYTNAIISLNKAISLNPYLEEELSPYLARAHFKRAAVHSYNGNHPRAVADLDEAIRLAPEAAEFRQARAAALQAMKLTRGPARAAPAPQRRPERPPSKRAPTPWYVIVGLLFLVPGAGVLVWMALQLKSAEDKKKDAEAEAASAGAFPASRGTLPGVSPGFGLTPAVPPPPARPEVVFSEARSLAQQGKFEEARVLLARKRQPDLADYHLFLEIYVGLCDLMRAKLTASQIADELYNKPGGKWDYALYLSLAGACKTPEAAGLAHQLRQMALTGMTKALSFQEAQEEFYSLADGFEKAGETDLALKIYGQFAEAGLAYKDVAGRRERLKAIKAAPPPKQGQPPPGVNVYGRTIGGRYDLKGTLGEGGMGTVYEAWDRQERRQVAVKRMHSWLNEYAEEYARFKHEAEIVARLRHPNIVGVFGVVEQDGDVYLVFEYLAGKTLSGLIRERKGLSLPECKDILGGVCSAVDYAHRQSVIHRDLKPGNIMVDAAGQAKVMDFGLASELRESMTRVTHQTLAGTPLYMAPEQDQGIVKKECDIYAIGVCLYEMLAGTPPFNNKDLLKQKMYKDYKEVTTLLPWLPSGVDRVIGRALEPEPALRYESPMDFYEELKALGER